jgi:hypothetical protein
MSALPERGRLGERNEASLCRCVITKAAEFILVRPIFVIKTHRLRSPRAPERSFPVCVIIGRSGRIGNVLAAPSEVVASSRNKKELDLTGSRKISERTLYGISLVVAALFLCNVYYQLHVAPNWQWGPALDKMPKQMLTDFMEEVYVKGKGGYAAGEYIAPDAKFDKAVFPEFADGKNVTSELTQPLIGDGRTVVAVHKVTIDGAEKTVVDVYHVGPRGGRIDNIQRYIAQ